MGSAARPRGWVYGSRSLRWAGRGAVGLRHPRHKRVGARRKKKRSNLPLESNGVSFNQRRDARAFPLRAKPFRSAAMAPMAAAPMAAMAAMAAFVPVFKEVMESLDTFLAKHGIEA